MRREIKFRIWSTENRRYERERLPNNVLKFGFDLFELELFLDEDERDNYIFEQYTGIKDKNGKEIYEGDIVFFFTEHFDKATGGFDGEDEHNATVEWFDSGFAFMDKIPYDPNIECEVIGNINENPELLGADNDVLSMEGEA